VAATTGDADAAAKSVNAFFQAITKFDVNTKNAVGLTLQEFITLQETVPEIAKALEQAFGSNLFDRLKAGPISLNEVLTKLASFKINFDNLKPPDTLAAAFGGVKTAWEELLKSLADEGAFGIVTQFLKDLQQGIKDSNKTLKDFLDQTNKGL